MESAINAGLNVLLCFMSDTLLSVLNKGFVIYNVLTIVGVKLRSKCFLNCLRKEFLITVYMPYLKAASNT